MRFGETVQEKRLKREAFYQGLFFLIESTVGGNWRQGWTCCSELLL